MQRTTDLSPPDESNAMLKSHHKHSALVLALVAGLLASTVTAATKPLKVFVLVGQSNMQGHARVRTLEHIGMDPKTAPLLRELQDENGQPRVCEDVWISYLSNGGEKHGRLTVGFGADEEKIGPEFSFGIRMRVLLGEPILIVKAAWGGKSLNTDFRPPSAGPYVFNEEQLETSRKRGEDVKEMQAEKAKATGHYYRLTIDHVKRTLANIDKVCPAYDAKSGYELAGFVWFQGWNDMVDRGTYPDRDKKGGYADYSRNMAHFIRDVRRDLSAPKLPFVIGVLGVNGPVAEYAPEQRRYAGVHQNFRDAMAAPAALPEFRGNVAAVLTENYWDRELSQLRAREAKVKNQVRKLQKDGGLKRNQVQATQERLMAEEFNAREREILTKGVSNAEYHYLGSAKIMTRIGRGFADALAELGRKP